MKNQIATYTNSLINALLLIVAAATPLLFLNVTTEFYETPKLIFLIVATILLIGLWIFSWIVKSRVSITRTPLDIPLLILLVVIVVSTYFSNSNIAALYGNFPKLHGSAVSWITYILLYFVTVSNIKSVGQVKNFVYVLYGSAIVVAIVSILSFLGIFLPFDFARASNFTPTGSTFSTVAFLLLLLPLPILSIIRPNKYLPAPAAIGFAILFGVTVVLIGSVPSYVLLFIAFALCFIISKPQQIKKTLPMLLIPVAAVVLAFVLAYLPLQGFNKLQQLEANFPKEIQLPLSTSWKITASSFRDAPFIGTGPSTYVFNFASYKPAEFNLLPFWNFSFDTAYNEFLQILGTLGLFGFLALALICLVIIKKSWNNLHTTSSAEEHNASHVLLLALSISSLLTVLLLAIHGTTLVSIVVSFLILAAFMASEDSIRENVTNFSMGIKASTNENQIDLLPIIIFLVFLIAGGFVLFKTVNAAEADYYHRMALLETNKSGALTYQYLQKAESLNPLNDLYRVDMAQTNFALANTLAIQKGPSKTNPKGSLTTQDKQTIQTLLSQAINEGRVSVVLSPRSARNWEVLASIYRNITGVAKDALTFALDAYGRAIQRDPLNPALRLSVGGIYYSAKNYQLAVRSFSDAINLKPDYVNAYYNLSIALRDGGDLQTALTVAQRTVALLQQNNATNGPDYKTAVALVADLKSKIAAAGKNSAPTAQVTPTPAGQPANSALQNSNLGNVNVNNLNNPPQVTPPPAVKPNPNSNLPQSNLPTPTSAPNH